MDGMDVSGCQPGARPPEGTPPPKRVQGAGNPVVLQELALRQTADSRSAASGPLSASLLTAITDRAVTAVPDTISTAALRQLTGPTLAERHAAMARLDRRVLEVIYGGARVTDCELLDHMAHRHILFDHHPDLIQLDPQTLLEHVSASEGARARRLLGMLPDDIGRQLASVPCIAHKIFRERPSLFDAVPEQMKTPQVLAPVLASLTGQKRLELLAAIVADSPAMWALLEPIEEAIKRHACLACHDRAEELDPELRQLAVVSDYNTLSLFAGLDSSEYSQLCDLALKQSGQALAWIHPEDRTESRVDRALAQDLRPGLETIPERLYSQDRLRRALEATTRSRLSCAFLDRWQLWDTLQTRSDWLYWLPENERSEALCQESVRRFPAALGAIPAGILDRHPEWLSGRLESCVYLPLYKQRRVPGCYGPGQDSAGRALTGADIDSQPWALVLQPWHDQLQGLPVPLKQAIVDNGGTGGLADLLQAPPFLLEPEALLDWVQGHHCSRRAALLPDQVCKALLCSPPFALPRKAMGQMLIGQIDAHIDQLAVQILEGSLPLWQPVAGAGDWTVRGGRTLVREENGRCVHLKFQRQGESLAEFGAEEAVQRFAWRHHKRLGFKSEIPRPEAVVFVPRELLPEEAGDFSDALQPHDGQGRPGYLAFHFTTGDHSYDTLAWQPDTPQGGDSRARDGLLRALHDIGVWSSMGAVHTSTIRLYHEFRNDCDRPELLLTGLFRPGVGYPGKLHMWNTRATDSSDWGWSGLRDLGDMEFYPFITSYVQANDAGWTVPDYGQRASFVNAVAQNILASLLHIMRLYRATDPHYHYRNREAVDCLGQFMEDGCNAVLTGLLGDGTRLQDFFPERTADGGEVYSQWRERAATEMIYWTARQTPDGDCFARHFQEGGCPSPELYPGHPRQDLRYPKDFVQDGGEKLGAINNKLPLFFLVRGLYMLAKGVADRLAGPIRVPQPSPGCPPVPDGGEVMEVEAP